MVPKGSWRGVEESNAKDVSSLQPRVGAKHERLPWELIGKRPNPNGVVPLRRSGHSPVGVGFVSSSTSASDPTVRSNPPRRIAQRVALTGSACAVVSGDAQADPFRKRKVCPPRLLSRQPARLVSEFNGQGRHGVQRNTSASGPFNGCVGNFPIRRSPAVTQARNQRVRRCWDGDVEKYSLLAQLPSIFLTLSTDRTSSKA